MRCTYQGGLFVIPEQLHPGQLVKFKLGDIHLPDLAEVMARMTGETELHGLITLLSDHGDQRSAFVVVEVQGVMMPLIVPASSIEVLEIESEESSIAVKRNIAIEAKPVL